MDLSCPECGSMNCISVASGWLNHVVGFSRNPPVFIALSDETEKNSPCIIVECTGCYTNFWFHICSDISLYADKCRNWPEEK